MKFSTLFIGSYNCDDTVFFFSKILSMILFRCPENLNLGFHQLISVNIDI